MKDIHTIPVALAADHGGFALKEAIKAHLESRGIPYRDFGTHSTDSCDYPDLAAPACDAVVAGECSAAILCCGTGACCCSDAFSAEFTRRHNDANALCLGGRVVGEGLALTLVDLFLDTPYEGGRHANRVAKVMALENR